MSFRTESKQDLVNLVNARNGTSIALADVTFSLPQVVAGTWREGTVAGNTAVRLIGLNTGAYTGSKILTYDRLDLSGLGHMPGWGVSVTNLSSVHQLLPNIKYYTGINFTTDDLQDLPVTLDAEGAGNAQLSAHPNSIGWKGSVLLPVTAGGIDLATAVTQPILSGLNYPTAQPGTDVMGPVYLYGYDFTLMANELLNQDPGVVTTQFGNDLVTVLQQVDVSQGKLLWNNSSSSTTWSLQGAEVVYNGMNLSTMPTNPLFKYVMELKLRTGVTSPVGHLYLHYNDAYNPDDF